MKKAQIAAAFCFALLALTVRLTEAQMEAGKKGVGEFEQPNGAKTLTQLRVHWYYNWKPRADVRDAPERVQYIPMIWGPKNLNARDLQDAKGSGAGVVLGFNEPNEIEQSHMTVAEAVSAWPQLEALNVRLGSPATGTGDDLLVDGWLARFMAQAKARHLRVDFICLHPYQSSFDPDQATLDLVNEVKQVHERYNLPIWVTEYAMARWKPAQVTPSAQIQAAFIRKSAAALERLPFVERYAWFGDLPNQSTFSTHDVNGAPTDVGRAWAGAPQN